VNRALWDSNGTIQIASFDELAGCSFISTTGDLADSERRIREVVTAESVRQMHLHRHMTEVPAVRLDDWVERSGMSRLDFIKMDVEGAESHVLQGAAATLQRFRPILLTEYNPACSDAYFNQPSRAYFDLLRRTFSAICALNPDGSFTATISNWDDLNQRLEQQGWADLVCSFDT
jgi:FkbM family methyltransferase